MAGPTCQTPATLLGLTGLRIGGGIASVARCVTRVFDELAATGALGRVDRVLLQDDPSHPPATPLRGEQRLSGDRQLRFVWQLWRLFRREHHDLVFFDQLGPARSVRLPLPGFPPKRYVVFCHGIELGRAVGEGARRQVLAGAWRLLTNSTHTAEIVRAQLPEAAERVVATPLCIDPDLTALWTRELRDPPQRVKPAVLIVGRMCAGEPGKGHDALFEAWDAVRRRVPEAELWVVGSGDDRPRLEARARQLAPAGSVRFLGKVSDVELGRLYGQASIFAMPSQQEGFGLVYAEAMWHGLACIGSTADAAGEVIEPEATGVLVPYGDPRALARTLGDLLTDPERCRRLGEAARRRAREHFGYERFRDDLLRALELRLPGRG